MTKFFCRRRTQLASLSRPLTAFCAAKSVLLFIVHLVVLNMVCQQETFVVTGGSDRVMRFWDLREPPDSYRISGDDIGPESHLRYTGRLENNTVSAPFCCASFQCANMMNCRLCLRRFCPVALIWQTPKRARVRALFFFHC